jgi:lysophospholipase L1-like esterase
MASAREIIGRYAGSTQQNADDAKTVRTILFFVLLAVAPGAIPGLEELGGLTPGWLARMTESADAPESSVADPVAPTEVAGAPVHGSAVPGEIEDPSGRALDAFFAALDRTSEGRGRAVVCHYGDSPITNDDITSTIRRRLQARFGDAGHGFVLAGRPWGWYRHEGVSLEGRGWQIDRMFIGPGERRFGLGGVVFRANGPGAVATFETPESGPGGAASAFEVYYLAQPGGGELSIALDGVEHARFVTQADVARSEFRRVEATEGPHTLTVRSEGGGEVAIFGVTIERGTAGVQYDSLGVNGAFVGLLAKYMDFEHWSEQLRHRRPDLVVLAYGTNESEYEKLPFDQYERDTREVIRRIREALPDASILFVGPMDRGTRGAGGTIVSRPMIRKLSEYQRRIAAETGCAFFDTQTAMGGEGTVARWHETKPKLMGGDLTHPTAQGAEIVGSLIYEALERAYDRW